MKSLNPNWITEGKLDFEYKKYILLAYLQQVSNEFRGHKLYPVLSDLIFHFKNLKALKENRKKVINSFPKKISKVDLENFKLEYERIIEDEAYMHVVEEVLNFAIPKIKEQLKEGQELYEFVEDKLEVFPVGVIPLNTEAGYMLLRDGREKDTKVYDYVITIFETAEEKYRGININFITRYHKSLTNTFESIKHDLLKRCKLASAATYVVESHFPFPLQETLLPIAKRSLVRYIAHDAA